MLFVTGATGRMGSAVLQHAPESARAGSRSGRNVAHAAQTVRFDFEDPATFAPALEGCESVFLMRPPSLVARAPFDAFTAAVRAQGVGHVVCASVWGAGTSRVLPHRHMEAAVRDSGVPHTFLRPADFMQNLCDVHGEAIRQRDEIALPAGQGRSAFLDVEDGGRATTAILADPPRHAGQGYDLTGPEALSFADVASALGQELVRPIRYRPVSVPRFVFEQVRGGRSFGVTLVMAALYSAQRFGKAAPVRPDFERLTGETPRSLTDWLEREARCFERSPAG